MTIAVTCLPLPCRLLPLPHTLSLFILEKKQTKCEIKYILERDKAHHIVLKFTKRKQNLWTHSSAYFYLCQHQSYCMCLKTDEKEQALVETALLLHCGGVKLPAGSGQITTDTSVIFTLSCQDSNVCVWSTNYY